MPSVGMLTAPTSTMSIAHTVANTGRSMKKRANMLAGPRFLRGRDRHAGAKLLYAPDDHEIARLHPFEDGIDLLLDGAELYHPLLGDEAAVPVVPGHPDEGLPVARLH